jgi:replicative DNA helicase
MPPQDLGAEVCVLGSMILDKDGIGEIIPILRAEHFYRQDHRLIYDALISLYENNKPIDLVLLQDELDAQSQLESAGGAQYLVDLVNGVPSAANMVYYARIVRDKGMLRNLITTSSEINNMAYEARGDVGEVMEMAEQKIFEVTQQKITGQAVKIKDIIAQVYESLEQRSGQMITGVATGFLELDELTCGLQRGEMIIIAARPSMGKTALGLNIAENVGANSKMPVAIFSLEMGAQQLAERMLSGRAHINSHKLRQGLLTDNDYNRLAETAGELSPAPIFVDDSPSLSPLELRAKARRLKLQQDIQLVVVDYLQLMHVAGVDSRVQEVGQISRHLKALARELNVPVIAMSQLNRSPEGREGHRPRMSDLRESGNIEQDADVVIMLHRESYYKQAADKDAGESAAGFSPGSENVDNMAELIITKQRNGPTGTVKLTWIPEWTRFENLSKAPEAFGM